jgi:4-hydroxybenzoate polyprenyltransferase
MVKLPGYIISLLRLIRWRNLLIVAATQVLIRQCILVPLLRGANMDVQLSGLLFFVLILATVFITAGGYTINDYFDRKIDRINKPDDMIVGIHINPRHAMAYHLFFSITGVVLGSFVAFRIGQLYLSLVFFMVSGLLWFYSTTYKRELLLGNIIVALLTAMVPFIVLLFEMPLLASEYGSPAKEVTRYLLFWVLGFSFFAFLLNLAREIVKDAQDFEGDKVYGKRTIPVAWGINAARIIAIALILLINSLLIAAWLKFISDMATLIYFTLAIVLPLVFVAYKIIRYNDVKSFAKANIILKIIMVTGLGYAVLVNLIIKNMMR